MGLGQTFRMISFSDAVSKYLMVSSLTQDIAIDSSPDGNPFVKPFNIPESHFKTTTEKYSSPISTKSISEPENAMYSPLGENRALTMPSDFGE